MDEGKMDKLNFSDLEDASIDGEEQMLVLQETNALLEAMSFGSKSFDNYQDLTKSASSMFVAIYEKMFHQRLARVIRVPASPSDYINNAQEVIQALGSQLSGNDIDVSKLTGTQVSAGDAPTIRALVQIFMEFTQPSKNSEKDEENSKKSKSQKPSTSPNVTTRRDEDIDKSLASSAEKKLKIIAASTEKTKTTTTKKHRTPQTKGKKSRPKKKENTPGHANTQKPTGVHQLRYKQVLKEHVQSLRQRDAQSRKRIEREINNQKYRAHIEKIRAVRLQHDLRLQRLSLSMQETHEEEQNLESVMKYMLQLEREKLREERRDTESAVAKIREIHATKQAAVSNFYNDQIQMIKDQVAKDQADRQVMEHAQKLASAQLLREFEHQREHQLQEFLRHQEHLKQVKIVRGAAGNQEKLQNLVHLATAERKMPKPTVSSGHIERQVKPENPLQSAALYARRKKQHREQHLTRAYGHTN